MYHKVTLHGPVDFLTIRANDLEVQFRYLQVRQYTPILLSDLVQYVVHGTPLPPNPVLITFDDGYRNNYTLLYPLLQQYNMKASIFLVPAYLQKTMDLQDEEYLHLSDLQAMDPSVVEYGLHSFDHKSYKSLGPRALDLDIQYTKAWLASKGIPFQPCLAYPYGACHKRNPFLKGSMSNTLRENDIVLAFRIGNRLNSLPLRNTMFIQRLDIRGDAPFDKFVRLLHQGRSGL